MLKICKLTFCCCCCCLLCFGVPFSCYVNIKQQRDGTANKLNDREFQFKVPLNINIPWIEPHSGVYVCVCVCVHPFQFVIIQRVCSSRLNIPHYFEYKKKELKNVKKLPGEFFHLSNSFSHDLQLLLLACLLAVLIVLERRIELKNVFYLFYFILLLLLST